MLFVIEIIAVIETIAIPGLLSSIRAANERSAATSLKTLTTAEADFRANDRDWNHVNDYWTGDVKGLYTLTSATLRGTHDDTNDPPIKLISLNLACSDADDAMVDAGGENLPLRKFSVPSAYRGYWCAALL